jgi:peptidoglycan hydrolase-like protein with peptidoglycan-binding domain
MVILLPIDCRNAINDLQVQVCDEGVSVQKIRAVLSEDGYYTEIEWSILVSTWVEQQPENKFFSTISSPAGIIGIALLLIGLAGGGFALGSRISRVRELQEALEAYGVNPERLAIEPEKKGVDLPSAPDFSWSNDEV